MYALEAQKETLAAAKRPKAQRMREGVASMRVFLNPGHDPLYDSGAVNAALGLRECDVAADIGARVKLYLELVGMEVFLMQSDNLAWESRHLERWNAAVTDEANKWRADVFVSLHCNAADGEAHGTETLIYARGGKAERLARAIEWQITTSLGTKDRGIKERPELIVLHATAMPAVLVEMAFIDHLPEARLLVDKADVFARAIARAVTDYEAEMMTTASS